MSRSTIWLAMLELAATSSVPRSTTAKAAPLRLCPAVSQAAVATVASTMTAILGRMSRETSAAVEATAPADGESVGSAVMGIVEGDVIGHLARSAAELPRLRGGVLLLCHQDA